MSTAWAAYPDHYRAKEIERLAAAVRQGECAALLGLSGSGKSNLVGYLAHREVLGLPIALIDCNRMAAPTTDDFWRLLWNALCGDADPRPLDVFTALNRSLTERFLSPKARLCLLFDRFDGLPHDIRPAVENRLRALRDEHKYALTFLLAMRRPPPPHSELAELLFAHTVWLGPLSREDALWSIAAFAQRAGLSWEAAQMNRLLELSAGYPALLRAACQALADGCPLQPEAMLTHPAVRRRLDEFWNDQPTPQELSQSRLVGVSLLQPLSQAVKSISTDSLDTSRLTVKELLLWQALLACPGQVCEKDDLIRSVWPEDQVFARGIRDDSLAQLVRRLRRKLDRSPAAGKIETAPGRGYRFIPA